MPHLLYALDQTHKSSGCPMSVDDTLIPNTPSAEAYTAQVDRPGIPDVDEPFSLLEIWLKEARESEPNDSNAMSLATVDSEGNPDVRIVLLKDIAEGVLTFYTNLESAKGQQLIANPNVALCLHWKSLRRQVRIRGTVRRAADEKADAYFSSRAAQSRIAAIASDQSRPLKERAEFEQRIAELSTIYGDDGDIPRPDYWGGFEILPVVLEFWQDQAFRMHDRLQLTLQGDAWMSRRLYP